MEELHKFDFGTIVCDGCACRRDSNDEDDEKLHDIDDLLEFRLEDLGWVKQSENKWFCPDCANDPSHRIHPGEGRIISEKQTLSGLRCDHCGKEFENCDGFSMWEDGCYTEENAFNEDWRELGGRMLCPDCRRTCDAMDNIEDEDEDWEKKYCSKCPHKDDCNEEVEREIPDVSLSCESAVRTVDEQSRVHYECCPYLESRSPLREKCNLPEGKKCPRIEAWETEREEVAKKNKEIKEWVKKSDN